MQSKLWIGLQNKGDKEQVTVNVVFIRTQLTDTVSQNEQALLK